MKTLRCAQKYICCVCAMSFWRILAVLLELVICFSSDRLYMQVCSPKELLPHTCAVAVKLVLTRQRKHAL